MAVSDTSSMDIDAALHELGMLSAVTESRREYLKENECRSESCTKLTKQGFTVVQMNPMFVTQLQPVKTLPLTPTMSTRIQSSPMIGSEAEKSRRASFPPPNCTDFHVNHNRVAKIHTYRSRVRFRKPYSVPSKRVSFRRHSESEDPSSPKVDNGIKDETQEDCKVKEEESTPQPVKIKRSKSLDDLTLTRVQREENSVIERLDVENISKNFQDLKVS
ncbi:uncharacterized protein LOC144444711 [Glandiceps talaboti]